MTPPFCVPKRQMACVDLAEKRSGPILNENCTLTTANGRRIVIVEDLCDGKGETAPHPMLLAC
jgi:hypothetical protein|eukprot:31479-Pelagococcus_subviridis.AAC.6